MLINLVGIMRAALSVQGLQGRILVVISAHVVQIAWT